MKVLRALKCRIGVHVLVEQGQGSRCYQSDSCRGRRHEGMTLRERLTRWYRRNWRGYRGNATPLRCRLGRHDWSPNLLTRESLRICRNCVQEDRT